jgi:diguanylate cyclase (GGDEF)-like protein/PAS domain S-box-containing protein
MSGGPLRVLVADDDLSTRLLMEATLRKLGLEVTLAVSGLDALQQFRRERPDMVMLDVDMPEMSGHEACAILRAEAGALLPIVMVTGMDDLASIDKAYESGATDFIPKPINWALLGHRVRYLLRGYQTLLDLRRADARNAAVLSAIPDLLFELDEQGRFVHVHSARGAAGEGYFECRLGRTLAEVLPPAAAQVCQGALAAAAEKGSSTGQQFEVQGPNASRWFELSVARKAGADGDAPHFIVLSRDITERKEAEIRIARLAYFDSLTGLPNRQSFLDRVDREIRRAGQDGRRIAVLFMDLDGFKNVNDTMGHGAGDLILQWAAKRLAHGLRPTDVIARPGVEAAGIELSRLGGDEFAALILEVETAGDALVVAHRIGQLMRRPFLLEERAVTLTTSIGIALYPDDGTDAATLLKHADTAMYHAKNSGRDNAQIYSASLTEQAMQRLELNTSLRAALEREEFTVVYQPQIDLQSGRAHAVEALVRWRHPVRGLIAPLEFIPIAEEFGMIEGIGRWVLRRACTDAARWNAAGLDVDVAVNLSPLQLEDAKLPDAVAEVLTQTGLAAQRLELEITESSVMENSAGTIDRLHRLRELGVRIALDDFGTGYSSLGYLTRMPIGNLKVDRCFVSGGSGAGGGNTAIVGAVLAMAGSLGMRVTAEGVETREQARALIAMNCHNLQGYYFSRPVPAAEIPALLRRRWTLEGAEAADDLPEALPEG